VSIPGNNPNPLPFVAAKEKHTVDTVAPYAFDLTYGAYILKRK
jgi:hypothetical protein